MVAMIYFDTLKYVETLEGSGIPEKQAKAIVKAHQEAMSESLEGTLATKADIISLKSEMETMKSELRTEMQEMKSELHTEMHEMKTDISLLKWMIGFVFAGTATLILKAFF